MAAVLTNGKGFYDPLVYVLETCRLGLKFLPPSVNEPGPAFAVHGDTIRVPLIRAKGLSSATTERLLLQLAWSRADWWSSNGRIIRSPESR
jgi:error-prone DNA polymerase